MGFSVMEGSKMVTVGCRWQAASLCNPQLRQQGLHPALASLHLNLLWLQLALTDGFAVTWSGTAWEPFVTSTVFHCELLTFCLTGAA